MKRLLKLTLGLLIFYVIIRLLSEYLRPVRVAPSPPPEPEPPVPEAGRLNLNQADATTLTALPGIGAALAERIVAYRQQSGPLARLDDLTQVRGVGPALVERLRPLVTLE
jgi:competence protein ComEA